MQALQEVQKSFYFLGISPNLKPFNPRILSFSAFILHGVILLWLFVILEADGSQEYMESIYANSAVSGTFLCLLGTIFMSEKLFSFFKALDEALNESK